MEKHTQEPWVLDLPDYDTSFVPVVRIGELTIEVQDPEDGTDPVALARLIHASPNLLKALKRLTPTRESGACDCEKDFECKYCFARKAIAKAGSKCPVCNDEQHQHGGPECPACGRN